MIFPTKISAPAPASSLQGCPLPPLFSVPDVRFQPGRVCLWVVTWPSFLSHFPFAAALLTQGGSSQVKCLVDSCLRFCTVWCTVERERCVVWGAGLVDLSFRKVIFCLKEDVCVLWVELGSWAGVRGVFIEGAPRSARRAHIN